jgi:hypothetical protein
MKKHQRRRPSSKQCRAVAPGYMLIDELRRLDTGDRFWHGGAPGLQAGDFVLPASETGTLAATDKVLFADAIQDGAVPYSSECVYLTNNIELALIFAGRYRGLGSVYEVSPVGRLDLDPDGSCAGSYICERAKIVSRVPVHPRVLRTIRGALRLTPDGRTLVM